MKRILSLLLAGLMGWWPLSGCSGGGSPVPLAMPTPTAFQASPSSSPTQAAIPSPSPPVLSSPSSTPSPTPSPTPPAEVTQATTSSAGQVELTSERAGVRVQVTVQDQEGASLPGIVVKTIADSDQVVILALDPTGRLLPEIRVLERDGASGFQTQELTLLGTISLIMLAASVVSAIHEYATDPPRVDVVEVGDGKQKKCVVGDVRDLSVILGPVVSGAAGHLVALKFGETVGKVVRFAIGAGTRVADLVPKLSEFMGQDRKTNICWHEALIDPAGKPIYMEVGPLEALPLAQTPSGLKVDLIATGNVTGHVADLYVWNQTDQAQSLLVFPGISFRNKTSSTRQDMTVTGTISRQLAPGASMKIAVTGACINRHRDPPLLFDEFVPFNEQNQDLVKLGQAIDRLGPPQEIAQRAVWVITDNVAPPAETRDAVQQLLRAAGLNPI